MNSRTLPVIWESPIPEGKHLKGNAAPYLLYQPVPLETADCRQSQEEGSVIGYNPVYIFIAVPSPCNYRKHGKHCTVQYSLANVINQTPHRHILGEFSQATRQLMHEDHSSTGPQVTITETHPITGTSLQC